jgi:general secretion pathway protein D
LAAAVLAPAAHGQGTAYVTAGAVYVPGQSFVRVSVAGPGIRTTVLVPDGGTVSAGGYSRLSEARSEAGAPIVSKLPYVNRGFRNVGYGRDVVSVRVNVSARVIDLREEEYLQTGYRSP